MSGYRQYYSQEIEENFLKEHRFMLQVAIKEKAETLMGREVLFTYKGKETKGKIVGVSLESVGAYNPTEVVIVMIEGVNKPTIRVHFDDVYRNIDTDSGEEYITK